MTNYDIAITAGSHFDTRLFITNSDGSIINLTDFTARGHVRYAYSSNDILLDLKPTVYSAISGIVSIVVSGSQSTGLSPGVYPYNIELDNSGYVFKPINGYCYIYPDATR